MKEPITRATAAALIPDGATLMIGGFMGVGTPDQLIQEPVRRGTKNLTVIANDTARPGVGIGRLIDANAVSRAIVSHIGTNPVTQEQMLADTLHVELVPQGTLAEQVRAGGYGLGGVLTPTAVGTIVEKNKRVIEIDGEQFLLEKPLKANFAMIKAQQSDYYGNLQYRLTAQNFNPLMAMAGDAVIAEVEELVPVGYISPDHVHTPGSIIDYLVKSDSRI
jgi:acetate CoA/acetoacetate CoA-transferase alpha subunit